MADQRSSGPQSQIDGSGHVALSVLDANLGDTLLQMLQELRAIRKAILHLACEDGRANETDFYSDQQELTN